MGEGLARLAAPRESLKKRVTCACRVLKVSEQDLVGLAAIVDAAMHPQCWGEGKTKVGTVRKRRRAQGCGSCPGCVREDCGQCRNCKDKVKFGGPGTKKQRCMLRTCTNMQRKLQRQESVVEEKDLTSVKITCVFCGRKRKKGLSRSALFCTKHCQTRWQDSHPGETPSPVPQSSDGDESMANQLLEEAFSEQTFATRCNTADTGVEKQLCIWTQSPRSNNDDGMNSPRQNTSSIPYPLTLSPSPTPLSSPTIYTPPSSAVSQASIDKWKEIAKKLSFHSELRRVWNQLKIGGGFLTNEHFICHLLRHEASRQSVQYDVLSVNETDESVVSVDDVNIAVVTRSPQASDHTPVANSDMCEQNSSQEKPSNDEYKSLQLHKDKQVNPSTLKTDSSEDSVDVTDTERDGQGYIELYQPPDGSKEQCVTVLDFQIQCSPDETDLEISVDEVIDSM